MTSYANGSSLRLLADAGAEFELGLGRLELPLEALSVVAPINSIYPSTLINLDVS